MNHGKEQRWTRQKLAQEKPGMRLSKLRRLSRPCNRNLPTFAKSSKRQNSRTTPPLKQGSVSNPSRFFTSYSFRNLPALVLSRSPRPGVHLAVFPASIWSFGCLNKYQNGSKTGWDLTVRRMSRDIRVSRILTPKGCLSLRSGVFHTILWKTPV